MLQQNIVGIFLIEIEILIFEIQDGKNVPTYKEQTIVFSTSNKTILRLLETR